MSPDPSALAEFDKLFAVMQTAGRGTFVVLRGSSGSGKSTFLHTLSVFKENVRTVAVPGNASIREALEKIPEDDKFTVYVLEEREAATSFTDSELETWLHEINGFLRRNTGAKSLVVWPCNTDALRDRILPLARSIGGTALLGLGKGCIQFAGPEKDRFVDIASKTLSLANQSASIADLGLSHDSLSRHVQVSDVIGDFYAKIQGDILAQQQDILALVDKEQCRLWILVAAGNEPDGDVAALTRGSTAAIDTERLMSATGANIVADMKQYPEKIGIVGTVLDVKIFHLPVLVASSLMRAFASDTLKTRLASRRFQMEKPDRRDATDRLRKTDFANVLAGGVTGLRSRKKLGSKSIEAFEKLASIAEKNDSELNAAIGSALVYAGLATDFKVEQNFGSGLSRRTDLLLDTGAGPVRVEVMWRRKTGRAEVANYTLGKVANYARAIGFIK